MKINSDKWRKPVCDEPFEAHHTSHITHHSRSAMALVITLILLSVTLVMIIALLAVARRERASVGTSTDTTIARLASDTALAAAQAQIIANLKSSSAAQFSYGMLVSTNYINPNGFDPTLGANPVNVNFDFVVGGGALSQLQQEQNIANLQILPRAPVQVGATPSDSDAAGRFYLDMNRNNSFDTNGIVANIDENGNSIGTIREIGDPEWIGLLQNPVAPHAADNKFLSRYSFIVLPIGQSLDLNYMYNEVYDQTLNNTQDGFFRNQGVGSWEINLAAFLADLNINQWNNNSAPYFYYRPIGIANAGNSFFDADSILTWRYNFSYNSLGTLSSAFNNNNGILLNGSVDMFPSGPNPLNTSPSAYSNINGRWAGSPTNNNYFYSLPSDLFNPPNSFGTMVGFSNRLMSAGTYTTNGVQPTYDRYTYYRMLQQLGTDSLPANQGKLNLNYSNAIVNYGNFGAYNGAQFVSGAETNLVSWRPLDFYCAAADMLLKTYSTNWFQSNPSNYLATYYGLHLYYTNALGVAYDPTGAGLSNALSSAGISIPGFFNDGIPAIGLANIPVVANGKFVYSPAVNRLLQLAANIYDASTNNFYPSVFRPILKVSRNPVIYTNDITIVGFEYLPDATGFFSGTNNFVATALFAAPVDVASLTDPNNLNATPAIINNDINVYGVPWIIGAKKGFPNFNKFGMQDVIQVTRKLEVARKFAPTNGTALNPSDLAFTNQMYVFSISNNIGVEFWNSYTNPFQQQVYISVSDYMSMKLTNDYGLPQPSFNNFLLAVTNYSVNPWVQYVSGYAGSFKVPLNKTAVLLTNSDLYFGTTPPGISGFWPDGFNYGWEINRTTFDVPHFGLLTTNLLQLSMVAQDNNNVYHVIDYVQLAGPNTSRDLNATLFTNSFFQTYDNMWATNQKASGVPYGIDNQWNASIGAITLDSRYWKSPPAVSGSTPQDEIAGFCKFLGLTPPAGSTATVSKSYYTTNNVVQLPYAPTATISDYVTWQANDPLIHYLASDLTYNGPEQGNSLSTGIHKLPDNAPLVSAAYGTTVNVRYQPWGQNKQLTNQPTTGVNAVNQSAYNLTAKDPLVWASDYWDFPTNKYPTVGWLGRVHRGTPWQTVYLKASDVLHALDPSGDATSGTNTWTLWSGDYNSFDANNNSPTQDRLMFDVFTASPNENASRGALSVNAGVGLPDNGLASWSAIFSGMGVITNSTIPQNLFSSSAVPVFTNMYISPAGVAGYNSPLGFLISSITNARAAYSGGVFRHKGDILSAIGLTENSPFLYTNVNKGGVGSGIAYNERYYGISDEAYEWLPQQMMGLVRLDSQPRYVVYAFGQTLKPAPAGTVLGSQFYGLVTNYQVVAESATRSVVTVQPSVTITNSVPLTNYSMKVESFDVLPPQ
jgi:hypothetical protein